MKIKSIVNLCLEKRIDRSTENLITANVGKNGQIMNSETCLIPAFEIDSIISKKTEVFKIIYIVLIISCNSIIYKAIGNPIVGVPELRDQISLNGTWSFTPEGAIETTIPVPEYWDARPGFKTDHAVYEREVLVPESFKDKRIMVEFESICLIADVFVNGTLVGNHIGGWIPFSFDITDHVTPGKSFVLKVDVKGGNHQPIVDKDRRVQWPVGWYGFRMRWGINSDVWLRAYGKVSIRDAYIVTSFRNKSVNVEYTLQNDDVRPRTILIKGDILNPVTGKTDITIVSNLVTLAPLEKKKIILNKDWNNPQLWYPFPDTRHPLYTLQSKLFDGNTEIDKENRRFGFREIWIENGHYMINGIRLNLWGNSIADHHEGYRNSRYQRMTKETWPQTMEKWFAMNVRFARFHMAPVDQFVLDDCDENGFLVLEESAIYARDYLRPDSINMKVYLENAKQWIKPWVISRRNHPCIIRWSAENEMSTLVSNWPEDLSKQFGEEVKKFDTSRPVSYDGESLYFKTFKADVYDIHYPEEYYEPWKVPIYGYQIQQKNVPNGIGEFLTSYGRNAQANQWMHGIIIRGLRYTGWADIRPYTITWALSGSSATSEKGQTLKNGCAFVALFDKEYDQLGIAPFTEGKIPELQAGSKETRVLALYNDEFRDTLVTVQITIKSAGKIYAISKRDVIVPLGEHFDVPCTFQVPGLVDSTLQMVLETSKQGQVKFSETKQFKIIGGEKSFRYSNEVTIGAPKSLDIPIVTNLEFVSTPTRLPNGMRAKIRLTISNKDPKESAVGQVILIISPDSSAKVIGTPNMAYNLKPGKSSSGEFVVESNASRAVISTLYAYAFCNPDWKQVVLGKNNSNRSIAVNGIFSNLPVLNNLKLICTDSLVNLFEVNKIILTGENFKTSIPAESVSKITGISDQLSASMHRIKPEPFDWYSGDMHIHRNCGEWGEYPDTIRENSFIERMEVNDLSVISVLADMGDGEVLNPKTDLPKVNGNDYHLSVPCRTIHYDAEWHWDPAGTSFEHKALGGHLVLLGLSEAKQIWDESPYKILEYGKKQGGIVGFCHTEYLNDNIQNELNCCIPIEYPVEAVLGTCDFFSEDVYGSISANRDYYNADATINAYYKMLNCGIRLGLCAGTDFPCNGGEPFGTLLTYVRVDGDFTYRKWVEGIRDGKTVIARNGHEEFIDLKVNGKYQPGADIKFKKKGEASVKIIWTAIKPLTGCLELVYNGKVIASKKGTAKPGESIVLKANQEFTKSGWLCARRMDEKGHQTHTAPIYITVNNAPVRASAEDAQFFVKWIDNLILKTSPGQDWNQYFTHDLDVVQGRYKKAKEIYLKIAQEALASPE